MRRMKVYETHPFGPFRKLSIVDEFLKLIQPCNGQLAPGAGQLLGVHGKEPNSSPIIQYYYLKF